MTRIVDADIAFQFDRGFPLAFLVFERAAGDAVNVVGFECRRFLER